VKIGGPTIVERERGNREWGAARAMGTTSLPGLLAAVDDAGAGEMWRFEN
jgi:hypothetical protein